MKEKIDRSVRFIEENVYQSISLKDIAGSVFLSPRHFYRLFKQQTGMSPAKYIERKKMEMSLQLLQQPGMQITAISDTLGYRNYETFSCRFKIHYHISPGDLKNILDTIRLQRNEIGKNLDFHLVSSCYQNIPMNLDYLQQTLANDNKRVEAFVATKNNGPGISINRRTKYHLSKYGTQ